MICSPYFLGVFMFYLIYISSAAVHMDDDALMSLLDQSRIKNLSLDVTGMLVYKDGSFMQMLEGEKKTVLDLFDEITLDNRHKGILTMMEGDIKARNFEDWSMGFCHIGEEKELLEFDDYFKENLTFKDFHEDSKNAYRFMVKFNELNR